MPAATYEQLLAETLPSRIDTGEQYDAIRARFSELFSKNRLTAAEQKLKNLLGVLIQDYDRRHALPPDNGSPADTLRFLLEESGQSPADLLPIFGQRSHVNEALNGKRRISAEQARKLGKMFSVKAGLFV
jgi:antitoxin component HigA of HigAB toxin-antitoxin module